MARARKISARPFSEDDVAEKFVERHGCDFRFVRAWGGWQDWDGRQWRRDETHRVKDAARRFCRDEAMHAETAELGRRISSDRFISAVVRLAASDRRIASEPSEWNRQSWLLNTQDGVIDLETGHSIPNARDVLITPITASRNSGNCPLWRAFVTRITDGDVALQAYLQRVAGYCLTGDTSEHVMFFLHGSGANGKSVFVNTIAAVMGSYAATAGLDTFMQSKSDRHLTELAGLHSARLVVVPETDPGRSWAEARIKAVTSGEIIRANFMYRDPFEFRPTFKLIVVGNHIPSFREINEAIRRRMHIVPFMVTIPQKDRDHQLHERLLGERDGILAWMLEGCRMWQDAGLNPPAAVVGARDEFLASEDLIGQWIEERCVVAGSEVATAQKLFADFRSWSVSNGHPAPSPKSLGAALQNRGFPSIKHGGQRARQGLTIRETGA